MTDFLNRVASLVIRHPDGSSESRGKVRAIQSAEGLSVYADGQKHEGDHYPDAGVTRILWFGPDVNPVQAGPRKSRPVYEWTDDDGNLYRLSGCSSCGTPRSLKQLTADPT